MTRITVALICVAIGATAIAQSQKSRSQVSDDALTSQLEQNLLAIRTANRSELPTRVRALGELAVAHDLLPALIAQYEHTAKEDYSGRRFLLGVIGELQEPRSLPFFVKVLSTKLSPNEGDSDGFSPRDEQETVLVKAVHGVGYMRTASARQVLLDMTDRHESHFVRAEAVRTYMWNSRDRTRAREELIRRVPASLRPFVTMPNLHPGMDRRAFDQALDEWRKQWAKPER